MSQISLRLLPVIWMYSTEYVQHIIICTLHTEYVHIIRMYSPVEEGEPVGKRLQSKDAVVVLVPVRILVTCRICII